MANPVAVFIVECPGAADLYADRSEGYALRAVLRQANIGAELRIVISVEQFLRALAEYQALCIAYLPVQTLPVLHISAHGNGDGIAVGPAVQVLSWAWLRERFEPINLALGGNLDICFSACDAYSAVLMAMSQSIGKPLPFNFLMAPSYKPTWGAALVGYAAFYLRLFEDRNMDSALNAIHAATGSKAWNAISASTAHELFRRELARVSQEASVPAPPVAPANPAQ